MITRKTLGKCNIKNISEDSNVDTAAVEKVIKAIEKDMDKRRRHPAPPPPSGGISLSDAARKYHIPDETISRWVKRGYIHVLQRTKRKVFIAESDISQIADVYKTDAGRGTWVIKKLFRELKAA